MFEAFLGKLKSSRRTGRRESLLTRDQKPRMLSPEAKRELERLQQDCDGDRSFEVDVKRPSKGGKKMRRFFGALMLMPLMAFAETEMVDGIKWTYTIIDGKAQIGTGNSSSRAIPSDTVGAITIPSVLGNCPVTSIGAYAFYYCGKLTSVTIPECVTNIGDRAFYGCSGLASVTIPSSVTSIGDRAFYNCSGLTSVTIPEGVSSIGDSAFSETPFLRNQPDGMIILGKVLYKYKGQCPVSVTIPEGVTSIAGSAFRDCRGLISVIIPEGVTSIGNSAFYYCSGLTSVTIPEGVTSIGNSAFYYCSGLTSVTIPPSVTNIGYSVFDNCSGLTSVTIPEGVTSIGNSAFYYCSGLTSVTIPECVTNIGSSAFRGCSGLTSVTIPESVKRIGEDAFHGCSGLTGVHVSDISAWCNVKFGDSYANPLCYARKLYLNEDEILELQIPDGVTDIGNFVFGHCSDLKSVTIPSSVTNIGDYAFYGCRGLRSVTIPSSVTSVGAAAFGECWGLMTVTIPSCVTKISKTFGAGSMQTTIKEVILLDGVTSIGGDMFSSCGEIEFVTIPASVTNITSGAFDSCGMMVSFSVETENQIYSSRNGLLCSKDGSVLVKGVNGAAVIPEGTKIIEDHAFYNCSGLTSVTIPSSVTSIKDGAFSGCSGLTSVTIPEGVTSIGDGAFSGCSGLTSVTIPEGVTSIGDRAFSTCRELAVVSISASVTNVGSYAFMNCSGLKAFSVEEANPCYSSRDGFLCSKDGTVLVAGINGNVPIPSSVTIIGMAAFYGYSGLKTIQIPKGVSTLDSDAFAYCRAASSVSIPNSVTEIGKCVFYGCNFESVYVDSVYAFGRIDFADSAANPLSSNTKLFANGHLVEDTVKVTFRLGDEYEWIAMFRDENSEWGFSNEKTLEVGIGRTVWPPEVVMMDQRFELRSWDADLVCVMKDVTVHPIYGAPEIHAALYWLSLNPQDYLQDYLIERVVYDVSSGCIRAQGTVNTMGYGYLYKLEDANVFGSSDERLYENLRISLIGRDDAGREICRAEMSRFGHDFFTWTGEMQLDTNEVCCLDVALSSTWYRGECCLRQIRLDEVERAAPRWQTLDLSDLLNNGMSCHIEGVKPLTIIRYTNLAGLSCNAVVVNGYSYADDTVDEFCYMLKSEPFSVVTNWIGALARWDGRWACSTEISVLPERYSARFDLLGRGERSGGGELVQAIDCLKGEAEVFPEVQPIPHYVFRNWVMSHWEGDTLVYVAEYEREYVISYENTKDVANPNPSTYMETNEVVFAALADTDEWHFDGWLPATIPVGSTGDVTVTALWRPIEKAEIVGGWSEPQTFEYDGKTHGVDYSARLDVMDWPLNVVTQGTIRAVNVGEYAATARAETVGVPETDTIYYRCAAVTNDCRWTITPKPVAKLQITYVSTAMIANGQPQTPQIVVRDMERGVVLTTADYTLAYENNVEPGMGIARITGKGNYGGETTIEFPIVAGVSPSDGLNMDGGTFEIVGETAWVADNVVTHDGYASMRSGAIGDGEKSALTSVIHGAGTVSFWWKVSSQRFDSVLELDRLEFYIDGERQKWINGDTLWTKVSYKVDGAGPHELKWVYVKDDSVSERQDCGWVDEVSWEREWLIGDWLNDVDREFNTEDGDSLVKWTPDNSVNADGVGAMRSGVCQQGQRSILSTVVENAGELTFKWKSSCVAYGSYITDKLSLLVDGVQVKDKDGKDIFINGQTDWLDVSFRISGVGRHEVQWVFEKVSDASMGQNCGWVDVVRWNGEPGTLTDADLVVDAFDGIYDGQWHGVEVSVTGAQNATVKYGTSRDTIGHTESPTFADCGEHEVWFAVNVPEFNEYVGKAVVQIRPRSIKTGEVTLGKSLVYAGLVQTQTVSSVIVDGLAATFEVADNEAREAGAYQMTVSGIGNFCGTLSVPFAVAKAQASLKDVVVEGLSSDTEIVEFTYDGKSHLPTVAAGYDASAVVRFSLSEEGPYADKLGVSNAVERLDVWFEIDSANYARLVGRTQMTIRSLSIEKAEVVLGEQVSDAEGHVVQLVDSVIVDGLSATFDVSGNVAAAEGDFELTVIGVGNFTGEAKCLYSVGGIVLPPLMTPGDGTIFTNALTVYISAQTPDSKCYYTLDGSMPTTNSLTARRVNLHGKTTIRAMAVLDGKLRSAVTEARYAFGACKNPQIRLEGLDGEVFHFPGQKVVIDWDGEEGVVRYTLDGSEPTAESPIYERPFAISKTTTVKAKAFSDTYFDSEPVTADMRLEVLSVPTPVIQSADKYCGTKTKISISCALDGAVIRYTLDGSEPTAMSALYEGEFEIGGELDTSIPVKARAFCDGYADSPVAEAIVTRVWGIGDTLGVPDMTFTTDGWVVDEQERLDGCASMRSAQTGDGETKTLATRVQGGGTVSFSWRTSCEDSDGDFIWDRAEFWVDDECIAKLEGESDWLSVVHEISDDNVEHRLRWLYVKDPEPETSEGEDCAWLNGVRWRQSGEAFARPAVVGDPDAIVTGDAETGFVVRPSEGKTAVEVTIPDGIDAKQVTVEVSPKVASVKPNGAKVKVVSRGANITAYLDIPGTTGGDDGGVVATQPDGVIDLTKATVKEAIVKEALDTTKGAVIELNVVNPSITTAPTKVGLKYTFREGTALEGLGTKLPSATKTGDGQSWSPKITVKGGNSAFYSIGVGKGE